MEPFKNFLHARCLRTNPKCLLYMQKVGLYESETIMALQKREVFLKKLWPQHFWLILFTIFEAIIDTVYIIYVGIFDENFGGVISVIIKNLGCVHLNFKICTLRPRTLIILLLPISLHFTPIRNDCQCVSSDRLSFLFTLEVTR